ncbi:MAG: hypothetical protein R3C18_11855 [Planctomycetaceae bacterium]
MDGTAEKIRSETQQANTLLVRRNKWYLYAGIAVVALFIYPCMVAGSLTESPELFWVCKLFLVLFCLPVLAYLIYQVKNQEQAIVLGKDTLRFATIMPWGRSELKINEICDCRHVFEYDTYNHLVLKVSPECATREANSWTWSWCKSEELWFDLIYTTPSRQEVVQIIRGVFSQNGSVKNSSASMLQDQPNSRPSIT